VTEQRSSTTAEPSGELATRYTADGAVIERLVRPTRAVELGLEPHPEGGWYRRMWTSDVAVEVTAADGSTRTRPTATLILFLLPPGEFSAWHRVSSTETWIWNGLGTVTIELGGDRDTPATSSTHVLGGNTSAGEHLQVTIAPNVWQRTLPSAIDALASCVVSPGFDFADFSLEPPVPSPHP
jgi:predicted cupin superfamily sugar epimerase